MNAGMLGCPDEDVELEAELLEELEPDEELDEDELLLVPLGEVGLLLTTSVGTFIMYPIVEAPSASR